MEALTDRKLYWETENDAKLVKRCPDSTVGNWGHSRINILEAMRYGSRRYFFPADDGRRYICVIVSVSTNLHFFTFLWKSPCVR